LNKKKYIKIKEEELKAQKYNKQRVSYYDNIFDIRSSKDDSLLFTPRSTENINIININLKPSIKKSN
jgi:hypothetical protein